MKKALSVILVLAMVISLIPATFAAEAHREVYDNTFEYVFNAQAIGQTSVVTNNTKPALNKLTYDNIDTERSDKWYFFGDTTVNNHQLRVESGDNCIYWNSYAVNIKPNGNIYAIMLDVSKAGTFIPSITYTALPSGFVADVHLVKKSDYDATTGASVGAKINALATAGASKIGTINMYAETRTKKAATFEPVTIAEGDEGDYLLLIAVNSRPEGFTAYHSTSGTKKRYFAEAFIHSFKLCGDNNSALANDALVYNTVLESFNHEKMWFSSTGTETDDDGNSGYRKGPYIRKTGTGQLRNDSFMDWNTTTVYTTNGAKTEPYYTMNLGRTDPWAVVASYEHTLYTSMSDVNGLYFQSSGSYGNGQTGHYLILKLRVPYAGSYKLSIKNEAVSTGMVPLVYFFPAVEEMPTNADCDMTSSGIYAKNTAAFKLLNGKTPLGYFNFSTATVEGCNSEKDSDGYVYLANVEAPAAGDYFIFFDPDSNDDDGDGTNNSFEKNPTYATSGSSKLQHMHILGIKLTRADEDYITSFDVSATKTELNIDETADLTISGTYALGGSVSSSDVTYTSSAPSVASVDENGKITAKAEGQAKILATVNETGNVDCVTVTVAATETKSKKVAFSVKAYSEDGVATDSAITTNLGDYTAGAVGSIDINTPVSVTATDIPGYTFRYWKRGSTESDKWVSSDKTYSFSLLSNTFLTAVYEKKTEEETGQQVEFWNQNGMYLTTNPVIDGEVEKPKPSLIGFVFDNWYTDSEKILDAAALNESLTRAVAQYTAKPATGVYVNGTLAADATEYNAPITCTATKEYFSCWMRDGKIVSYDPTYTYYVWDATKIEESTMYITDKKPLIVLDDKAHGAYMIEYDEGDYDIVEAGILFGDGFVPNISSCSEKFTSQKEAAHGQFTANSEYDTARGYVIYIDANGNHKVAYSN